MSGLPDSPVPRGVLVAAQGAPGRWHTFADGGYGTVSSSGDPTDARYLLALARDLAASNGGVRVRTVIFVTGGSGEGEPRSLSTYPFQVHAVSRTLALGHATSFSAPQFIVVDDAERLAVSVIRRAQDGRLSEQQVEAPSLHRVRELAAALGIEHFALHTTNDGAMSSTLVARYPLSGTLEVLPPQSHVTGAARLAVTLARGEGVWSAPDGASRLSVSHPVAYTLYRPVHGVFDERDVTLSDVLGDRQVLIVVDAVVDALHGEAIRRYARRHLNVRAYLSIAPSEAQKDWTQVERVCAAALGAGLDRRGIIVGIGGGIILDIAGLAASVYRRGVGYVRVSTTLVAMIDVSLGVKHAVNASGRKSLIGTFYPPLACINDYGFLGTLPRGEVSCGLAEVVKIALVRDAALFDDLDSAGASLLEAPRAHQDIWYRTELLMLEELGSNLFEDALARLADFGHTFSPHFETGSNFRLAHGQAVALDMLLSTALGVHLGVCDAALFSRVARLLGTLELPTWDDMLQSVSRLASALEVARQHRGGALNLVVPVMAGRGTFIQAVTEGDLAAAVQAVRGLAGASKPALPLALRGSA